MRRLILLAPALLAVSCGGDPSVARSAGYWPGTFQPQGAGVTADEKKLKGYLQLYATKMGFKLEMATPRQSFEVKGTWTAKGDKIRIVGADFSFDNPSLIDQKALNLDLILPDEVRKTFRNGLSFVMSADRRKLTGQLASFGQTVGKFDFERPIAR